MKSYGLFTLLAGLVFVAKSLASPVWRCPNFNLLACKTLPSTCSSFRMIYIRHFHLECPACLICVDDWFLKPLTNEIKEVDTEQEKQKELEEKKLKRRERRKKKRRRERKLKQRLERRARRKRRQELENGLPEKLRRRRKRNRERRRLEKLEKINVELKVR